MKIKFTLALICIIFLSSCTPPTPTPSAYTSKYTADQVIYIAQSKYPKICLSDQPSISVSYKGNGLWGIEINCPNVSNYLSINNKYYKGPLYLTFDERTGVIK